VPVTVVVPVRMPKQAITARAAPVVEVGRAEMQVQRAVQDGVSRGLAGTRAVRVSVTVAGLGNQVPLLRVTRVVYLALMIHCARTRIRTTTEVAEVLTGDSVEAAQVLVTVAAAAADILAAAVAAVAADRTI